MIREVGKVNAILVGELLSGEERVAVTGASGWVGRTALEFLSRAMGRQRFERQVTGFASSDKTVLLRDGTPVALQALHRLADLSPAPTHLLHFAFVMRDRVVPMGVPAYTRANLAILFAVVDAIGRFRPRGVFITSSGAVYRPDGRLAADVDADPYATLKHLEELAIRRATADAGGRSVVARVFTLGGPYMTRPEQYALGDFVLQALAGGPINIKAEGAVERSYCAAADIVAVALACLLREGSADVVFDSGGQVMEMSELAFNIRDALHLPDIAIERDRDPTAAGNRYVGDGTKMAALAAENHLELQSLQEQIRETASFLQGAAYSGGAGVQQPANTE